ncbi:hypothetical protein CSUI_000929 [Cystoisospora suis]|uniref:Uncharacterized protein n=1 Tax=Cystoisospora suis TaxID=483139 RepID=A0A2C6LC71_9APIC|nr:hypothetical protein CSUI_000929 [Cystoisospora suis]
MRCHSRAPVVLRQSWTTGGTCCSWQQGRRNALLEDGVVRAACFLFPTLRALTAGVGDLRFVPAAFSLCELVPKTTQDGAAEACEGREGVGENWKPWWRYSGPRHLHGRRFRLGGALSYSKRERTCERG